MPSKLVARFDQWMTRRERKKLKALDWAPLVDELISIIEDHSIFLETRFDGFVALEVAQTGSADGDVVAVAVAVVRDGLEPWETEAPARAMAERLSDHFDKPMPILLSRQWQAFVGYYVRVTA